MIYAPIALFTYCRADKTQRAVESLLANAEAKNSDLFIFSDGPKVYPDDDKRTKDKRKGVEENRKYIHSVSGFNSVTIIEREENWGLANSLISGITDVIGRYGKVIVVEDDLILSPYFLKFMNDALEKYKDDDRVAAVSAYVYPTEETLPENFFLRYFHCWGWATWDRAWMLFEKDTKKLIRKMRFKRKDFDMGGGFGAYGNLYCQKVGLVDSWWVRLYASFFLANKLTLYPGHSLSENEGCDGTGTHNSKCGSSGKVNVNWANTPISLPNIKVTENKDVYDFYKKYFHYQLRKENYLRKKYFELKSFIRRLLYIDAM